MLAIDIGSLREVTQAETHGFAVFLCLLKRFDQRKGVFDFCFFYFSLFFVRCTRSEGLSL